MLHTINLGIQCPKCKSNEVHPTDPHKIVIRAFKVDHYSQCLVCSGYYSKNLEETPHLHDPAKGWF